MEETILNIQDSVIHNILEGSTFTQKYNSLSMHDINNLVNYQVS